MCIANIPIKDKYFYWVKVEEFILPEAVRKEFYK